MRPSVYLYDQKVWGAARPLFRKLLGRRGTKQAANLNLHVAPRASPGHDLAMHPGPAYEERYRWTPAVAWALLGCIALGIIGILTSMPLVLRVLVIAFAAGGTVNSITYPTSQKVAFRVDRAGVTLGGSPFRYKATTRFFPWTDIEKIVLWERMFPVTIARWTLFSFGPLRYIGIERRPGAPPLSRSGTGMADKPAFHYSPNYRPPVPGIAAGTGRALSAWRLDDDQLTATLTTCAPTVQLVNATPATTHKQRETG